jgi:hypothetical protein
MAEVLAKTGIKREYGYLYFIDKNGNVARCKMARKGVKTNKKQEVLAKPGIKRQDGYLYFLDKNGNVARTKMARGGKKKAVKKAPAKKKKK